MKCPLFMIAGGKVAVDCLKEECAWWDVACSWCTIKSLDMELVNLLTELKSIRGKMPIAKK